MQTFHLSHIDLDGYGCQFVAREFFEHITFFNANYGKEVLARINMIFAQIDESLKLEMKFRSKNPQSFLILITDLNLTTNEAKYIVSKINDYKISGHNIELLLLDHHISGEECSKIYEWYHLDSAHCATKITFETLKKQYPNAESKTRWLEPIVEMINSVDIWKEDGFGFEFGKVALGMIASSNELNRFMFDKEHRDYKFYLLSQIKHYLHKPKGEVLFDNAIFRLKKLALKGDPDNETMDFITSRIQAKLLSQIKDKCFISYRDKKGFLSYSMGGISVLANLFLQQNQDIDFYMDINNRGNISLRANGKCDVCALSKEVFNGGGHKNASGGKMEGFKESFLYEDIKSQVQAFINAKIKQ
ncbi:DHH family phosphoesterase [Helicobacter fennelliae]|uniref:3'-to-5' oligoribonuclease B, Bacillus type n=1 Tax=Helicobacter fennelliae MRY12-0050 TaxID=1325130 RepID=T1D338_9HELI|nr:hypothetical protein [Helicobacter fennelliae]GAD19596.1 3'-to-5' oligoribonuclease B, Bacillus type [Helicobacter fennelliae MRY12-0050]STP07894.1 3'-to-5' oligoribonuclease B [Helicobacter fennelliae]